MKNRVSYFVALLAVLTGAASTGHAFTLGDLRGSAVIGRSLDVTVPVVPGAGEDVLATCLSAEVLFAESQQLSPLITVSQTSTGSAPAMVRIRSAAAVTEPVVTVVLRSICGSPMSRQYVLLSDFPAPDLPKASAPSAVDLMPLASSASSMPPQSAAGAGASVAQAQAAPTSAPNRVQADAALARPVAPQQAAPVKKRPKPAAAPVKPRPAPEQTKPVLKLDQSLVLPVQGDLPMPVAAPASAPASVPASAPSEEAVQQALRMEALQNDIKVLKELALKNEASLTEFQTKLRQAEAERVPLTWFYLLSGLLALCLATLAWVLRKQQAAKKNDEAWWQQGQDGTTQTVANAPPSAFPAPAATVLPTLATVEVDRPHAVTAESDVDLDIDLASLPPADAPPSVTPPMALPPADGFAMTHNINAESVSDIRQQAEFFVSLGQTDRALNVLRKQILESQDPNPLVYLDLLTQYHAQGLKSDFRELRAAFNRFFNGVVPDFPAFNLEGRDLLSYPEPLAVLARFWPNIEAIAFLEACIFRNDAAPMQMSFDLPAFRDLLMLHAVAEKVTSDSPWKMTNYSGLGGQSTGPAELAGMAMVMDMRGRAAEEDAKPVSVAETLSPGLDLDLAFPSAEDTSSASKPKAPSADGRGDLPFPDLR
ncbi:hypothetical protein LHU53_04325 [Rhodoferax sp. U2-2l]|uniref:type IV pilus assembly protein FimV n=1 Tax=Rhodoferax sp. U2-2l TaxID=2884000 RepID=UPI001D0B9950|nr:hypothetical protein [Rhodoferax sp. U2-2l]MCB8746129.1 hypothetical protein [Rhodoferax sp. U2-2l]